MFCDFYIFTFEMPFLVAYACQILKAKNAQFGADRRK